MKTEKEIHEIAEAAIKLIQDNTDNDIFLVGLVLNHMDRILATTNQLLVVNA